MVIAIKAIAILEPGLSIQNLPFCRALRADMSVVLADLCRGRDNNLNFLRMAAASAVLVSHSFPIALGPDAKEPLEDLTGMTLGHLAVVVFFALSGFLITKSFAQRQSLSHWLASRAARLFPALALVLLLSALVLGPLFTRLGPAAYFADPASWTYVPRNLLLHPMQFGLPQVFTDSPYPGVVNGSLWTLFYEVACYAMVMIAGLLGILARRWLVLAGLAASGGLCALVLGGPGLPWLPGPAVQFLQLAFPFVIGMAAWTWRERMPMGLAWLAGTWLVYLVARPTPLGETMLLVAVAHGALWCGFVPIAALRAYNRLGDYSYGTYLWAFPVQQAMVALMPGQGWLANAALSFPATLACAVLSWHLIEARALARVRRPAVAG